MTCTSSQDYLDGYGYAPGYPVGSVEADADGPLDVLSAVVSCLASWLRSLEFQHTGDGATFSFAEVFEEWPDTEDELRAYPVAAVTVGERIEREAYSLTPDGALGWSPDGAWALFATANVRIPIQLDVWCGDRSQRRDIARTLESAKAPDEQTSSLILTLGRYWGLAARFNWLASRRLGSDESARSREYRETYFLEATCPEVRATERPAMDPRIHSILVGVEVDPDTPPAVDDEEDPDPPDEPVFVVF